MHKHNHMLKGTIKLHRHIAFIILSLIMAKVAQAQDGGHMCWVKKVTRSDQSFQLYFHGSHSIDVENNDAPYQKYYYDENHIIKFKTTESEKDIDLKQDYLELRNGDVMRLGNFSHDGCTITVVERDGKTGVLLSASFYDHIRHENHSNTEFVVP